MEDFKQARRSNVNRPCTQSNCVYGFSTENERDEHEQEGNHEEAVIQKSIDSIILYFFHQKKLATARDIQQ